LKEYEDCSGLFIDSDNVAPGKEMYYSCKAHLCLDTSNREYAEHYFRKLLSVPGASDLRIAALDGLQRYYTKYFNKDSLVKYVSLSDSVCNVVHNDVEMQKTLLVQSMYDYSRNEHIALQKERESEQFRTYLIVLCSITVVIGLLSAIAYIRYRNERQSLEDRIRLLRGYAVNETLYNCPKAQYFRQLLNANPYQTPDNNDWKELSALIDREAPSFRRSLSEKIDLTDFEYDVCMLIKIQIPVSDIARLKHCTPANITKTRKNIYMKLFGKAGRADELDEYLMSLR
jgi:DNA-binding CsgD family transcriptional regulator